MNELALFAGAGGGVLGGLLHGWRTVAAVEIENYPRRVLLQRQADGILPRFPIWDDVCTFDGKQWRGKVDIVTGGFPCQDISSAGKGAGITGERSGLWGQMARIVDEVRPRFAFIENSPLLVSRGLDRVLADLAEIGYDARWCIVGADDCGAPHRRKRIWILAHATSIRSQGQGLHGRSCNKTKNQNRETNRPIDSSKGKEGAWYSEPMLGRVAHGVANRVDRLKAIGNGQVPAVAAVAWDILTGKIA